MVHSFNHFNFPSGYFLQCHYIVTHKENKTGELKNWTQECVQNESRHIPKDVSSGKTMPFIVFSALILMMLCWLLSTARACWPSGFWFILVEFTFALILQLYLSNTKDRKNVTYRNKSDMILDFCYHCLSVTKKKNKPKQKHTQKTTNSRSAYCPLTLSKHKDCITFLCNFSCTASLSFTGKE